MKPHSHDETGPEPVSSVLQPGSTHQGTQHPQYSPQEGNNDKGRFKMTTTTARQGETLRYWAAVLIVFAMSTMLLLVSKNAAAAPAAGTVIGNQATATYNDAGGTARSATSNLVQTTVSQVKSFTLTADGQRTAAPGQTVYYPHTITNTGNGNDSYAFNTLTSSNFAGAAAPHSGMAYYIDANGDGVPDNATPLTGTGSIPPGGIFRFVVAGTVPGAAANTNTAQITVSVQDTNVTVLTNTDTTTVASSVITVTKALSVTSGPSPSLGQIVVTLSYTNSGTAAATKVELRDTIPAGMTYVPGSGTWSGSPTALTDAALGDPVGIKYDYNITAANRVTAEIDSVPAGFSGNLTFKVTVNSGVAPVFVNNTASYLWGVPANTAVNTNTASYQVLQTASVVANGSMTNSANGTSEPLTVAAAAAGSTITFTDVIWNLGNATDAFGITLSYPSGTWPTGTTFTLLQSDGATSLIGNTTPSIPVYGAGCPAGYAADTTNKFCGYPVVLKVQLPSNASGGPYSVTMTATSGFDNSKTDTVIDTLTAVTANTVDLTLTTARSDSTPAGTANAGNSTTTGFGTTGTTVIGTNPVTPSPTTSSITRFALYVNNTGAVNDNFTLSTAGTPAGWAVVFRADGGLGNCSTVGSSLTSTGTLNAGANRLICAEVTVPVTTSNQAAPGTYNLDFNVASATNPSGVTDALRVAVVVNAVHNVTLTPNNSQQTFPGGSITYSHTLTNLGNAAEAIGFPASFLTDSRSGSGWTSSAYVDGNGNGVFEPGVDDVPANLVSITKAFSLPVNGSVTIFVRVFAPPSAVATDPANVTTLTASYNTGAAFASATDTTSVTDGLVLLKEQRTIACDGTAPGTYSTGSIPAGAATAPGKCLQYRITATNSTASSISAVVVNDNIPASTHQWNACGAPATTPGTITSPGDNATGTISASIGSLASLASAQVTFCVRIDP